MSSFGIVKVWNRWGLSSTNVMGSMLISHVVVWTNAVWVFDFIALVSKPLPHQLANQM